MRRRVGSANAVLLFGLFGFGACDERPEPEPEPGAEASSEPDGPTTAPTPSAAIPFAARFDERGIYHRPDVPLASRRNIGFAVAKGDQYDNKRTADPENYAITAPPARIADVRPMVEWETMSALVFSYPSYAVQMDQASESFVNIAKHASDYGQVWVLVDGSQAETIFKQKLSRAGVPEDKLGTTIKFLRVPLDSVWTIDFGPLPLVDLANGSYAFADFRYYHDRVYDDAIPTLLGRQLVELDELEPATTYRMPLTVEGGTFQATTDGVCVTGSRQLYNMSCYAGDCRESILELDLRALQQHPYAVEMRNVLVAYAGCKDLVVTHSLLEQEDTGHIDMYLKVLDDDRILLGEYRLPFTNDYEEANGSLMDDNARFLASYVKPDGGQFQVIRLPMPGHRTVEDWFGNETDLPFTYINSTFFNGLNLWPAYTFREWTDSRNEAESIWKQVLPDMSHVWIDSEELAYQAGAIHCVTRTIPHLKSTSWLADGTCTDSVCGGVEGGYDGVCERGGSDELCWGPQWLCECNDCRECPLEVPDTPCANISWRGCCDGGDVLFCDGSRLQRLACAGTGCGWDDGQGYYTCGLAGDDPSGEAPSSCACAPMCDGKTCGDDGCGGTCGTCDDGARCVAGACREDCVDCLSGELGCDGDTAWRCVAGPDGCNTTDRVDCAASGLLCDDGACASPPAPDPEPDVAEPTPDVRDDDTTPSTDSDARAETGAIAPRGGDDGCRGADASGVAGLALGLVALVSARARRAPRA